MSKIGIITQARIGSTRLPGKIMLKVKGKTLLEHHINRLRITNQPIIVATTNLPHEEPILELCSKLNIPTIRGSEQDVLSRYYLAWKKYKFDVMVRVTSDCPLIDPYLINEALIERVELQKNSKKHIYYSNGIERTYARGFDFEIFDSFMLNEANEFAITSSEREHVTPYFYLNKSPNIEIKQKKQLTNNSNLRVTVDEPNDFELISKLINDYNAENLSYQKIEEIILSNPRLLEINQNIVQKKI